MNTKLIPYLTFDKKAKEAMTFYQSVLGGELSIQSFGESGAPVQPEEKDLIIHAELKNGEMTFMASDGGREHPVQMGDNITMSLIGDDQEKLTEIFNKLAENGEVTLKLEKQFWGDHYGQLVDKFGIHWSVNISSGPTQQGG